MQELVFPLLIAGLLPIACAGAAKWGFKDFDNHLPRAWLARQEGFRARANAAQSNSFEAFPFFLAGVVVAFLSGADPMTIAQTAWGYVVLRVLFIACYLADWALLRTIAWTLAMAAVVRLFLFAL